MISRPKRGLLRMMAAYGYEIHPQVWKHMKPAIDIRFDRKPQRGLDHNNPLLRIWEVGHYDLDLSLRGQLQGNEIYTSIHDHR